MQIEIMTKTKETEQEERTRRLKRYREELNKGMEKAKAGAKGGGEHGRGTSVRGRNRRED